MSLLDAIMNKDMKSVAEILATGEIDVNKIWIYKTIEAFDVESFDFNTPMDLALFANNKPLINLLVSYGARVDHYYYPGEYDRGQTRVTRLEDGGTAIERRILLDENIFKRGGINMCKGTYVKRSFYDMCWWVNQVRNQRRVVALYTRKRNHPLARFEPGLDRYIKIQLLNFLN